MSIQIENWANKLLWYMCNEFAYYSQVSALNICYSRMLNSIFNVCTSLRTGQKWLDFVFFAFALTVNSRLIEIIVRDKWYYLVSGFAVGNGPEHFVLFDKSVWCAIHRSWKLSSIGVTNQLEESMTYNICQLCSYSWKLALLIGWQTNIWASHANSIQFNQFNDDAIFHFV